MTNTVNAVHEPGAESRKRQADSLATRAIIQIDRWIYRFARRWLLAFNAVMVAVFSAVLQAPIFAIMGWTGPASALYRSFSGFCHQDPDRSFHLGSHQLACCERCAAVYASLAIAGIVFAFVRRDMRRPRFAELVALLSPMVLDGMAVGAGTYDGHAVVRVVTGAAFGTGLIWACYPRFESGFAAMRVRLEQLFDRLAAQGRAEPLTR